jgi:hypothetical protein
MLKNQNIPGMDAITRQLSQCWMLFLN